jgi:hypothetical protein
MRPDALVVSNPELESLRKLPVTKAQTRVVSHDIE